MIFVTKMLIDYKKKSLKKSFKGLKLKIKNI